MDTDSEMCDPGKGTEVRCTDQKQHYESFDHDIYHLTKLKSEPSVMMKNPRPGRQTKTLSTTEMLSRREANYSGKGRFSLSDCRHVLSRYMPINGPCCVDRLNSRAYVSQFSTDGSLFIAGFQGSHIRLYNVDNGWKVQKDIHARSLRWTVTDTSLSPDKRHLVYSSLSSVVHIVNVDCSSTESFANITDIHEGLDFSTDYHGEEYDFAIFCVKFSRDGRELISGSRDNAIYVYDLEANKLTLRIPAHEADVNTVSFADETGHIIYSGSDDNLCKVWDRRCLARGQPAGLLMGHLEGITFLDSRGDGRYFISNGKDQSIKLWDIRKMTSNAICPPLKDFVWDYRWNRYPPRARDRKHPCDLSLATYQGHSILQTLIRCYFSPEYSTGQKYIYTGSYDNSVYIYEVLTGALVKKLEFHRSTVRDCSWHPTYPMLVSSSWDGVIAKWEFPGPETVPPSNKKKIRPR